MQIRFSRRSTSAAKTYKVELVSVDNQSSNDKAPSAAAELVSAGVSVVLGSYGSGVSIAAAPTFRAGEAYPPSASPAPTRRSPRATSTTSASASSILSRARFLQTTLSTSWATRPHTPSQRTATTMMKALHTTSPRRSPRSAARLRTQTSPRTPRTSTPTSPMR